MSPKRLKAGVVDANVLIDYAKINLDPVLHYTKNIADLYVPLVVLDEEVECLDAQEVKDIGLKVYEGTHSQYLEAFYLADEVSPSVNDCFCLMVAKSEGWRLFSNDKDLARLARREGVTHAWGLGGILKILAKRKLMSQTEVIKIARRMQSINAGYLSDEIVEKFIREVKTAK